jgi:16S rRNA (guanine527-N7)-methyltransferase
VPDTDHGGQSPAPLHQALEAAREAGFLGPGPVETHLRHAQGFVALAQRQAALPANAGAPRLLDLGSGGGLPGLVIANQWPEASLVLLDANQRRTDFLTRTVIRLGLSDRVSVVNARAETFGRDPEYRATFDGVVVRSFGPPAVVAECAAPLLRTAGWIIVSEPPGGPESGAADSGTQGPGRWPAEPLSELGLEPLAFVQEEFGYQVLIQREPCPDRFPRRNGVPTKHPLF